MISIHLPILQVILPLIAAPFCILLHRNSLSWWVTSGVSFLSFIIACLLFNQVLSDGVISYALGGWLSPWGIEYRIDKLTALMLFVVTLVALVVSVVAKKSVMDEVDSDRNYLFYTLFLLNLSGLLGVIITADAFNLFVFIEIASLSSYAMISVGGDKRCLYAAFRYLVLGTIGASFILIAVGLLYALTGTLNMFDMFQRLQGLESSKSLYTAVIFFTVGIGIKAAIFPLHLWMLDVYHYAPSMAAVFFAGTTTKVFIYVLIRFIYSVFGYEFVFEEMNLDAILRIMASAGILYGSYFSIKQDSLKRLLAYSSIAQLGYIVLGVALATKAGLVASLLHIFNHSIIKVTLFLSVVAILCYTKTDSISRLAGVFKLMPATMGVFFVAGLSLIGVPLTAGFISKWYLIEAAISYGSGWIVAIIVVSSLLSIVYIWKFVEIAYFKMPEPYLIKLSDKKIKQSSLFFMLTILVIANIYFGLMASFNVELADTIVRMLLS